MVVVVEVVVVVVVEEVVVAVVVAAGAAVRGALVYRSWGRAGGRVARRLESFLIVFSLSEVREQSGTMIMGI